MRHVLPAFLAILTSTAAVTAQTPTPWPLGCQVPSTIANNGTTPIVYQPCGPWVTDAFGQTVAVGICLQIDLQLMPGDTVTTWWGQYDYTGQQVPPGIYYVNGQPFHIGTTGLGIAPLGSPHPGSTRHFALCGAGQALRPYVMAASFSDTFGLPLGCGRVFPLDFDPLMSASLSNPLLFPDFLGVLNAYGHTDAPAIALPPDAWLVGIQFYVAAATIDAAAPCGVGLVSSSVPVTVQ